LQGNVCLLAFEQVVQVCLWYGKEFCFIGVFCCVQKYIVHSVLTLLSDLKMAVLSAQHAVNEAAVMAGGYNM